MGLPHLPNYVPVLTREVPAGAIAALPAAAVAYTLQDYAMLARKAGASEVRDLVGAGQRRIVVLGADRDSFCVHVWQRWPRHRDLLERHPPDLIVGPDLGIYDNDAPAARMLNFFAHTKMYAQFHERGIAAVVPIGWARESDVERLVMWVHESGCAGVFLDLQNRTRDSFTTVLSDLALFRHRLPADLLWLVKGVQLPQRWAQLRDVLGNVVFTSSGPWQEARNGLVFEPYTLARLPTDLPPDRALAQSVTAMTATADALAARRRMRAVTQQLQLGFVDTAAAS